MHMVYSTDDLSIENLKYFQYWDKVKERFPRLRLTAFVVAEGLPVKEFEEWFELRKDWVTIGVHCFNHSRVQEGWREDQGIWIAAALAILKPYLPKRFLYRPPGFRFLPKTEKILKDSGFAGIAHQEFIKYFDTLEKVRVFNTHCTFDQFHNPIGQIWSKINVSI